MLRSAEVLLFCRRNYRLYIFNPHLRRFPRHLKILPRLPPLLRSYGGQGRPYSEGAIKESERGRNALHPVFRPTLERREENRIEGRRRRNKCYCGWEIFLAGKSYCRPDLFYCCDLFFFSPEMRFLVFPMSALIFFAQLFFIRKKKRESHITIIASP
jgi:hypothetical protein